MPLSQREGHWNLRRIPHFGESDQQKKAKANPDLNGGTFAPEDTEQISYETDRFDRYVSTGSLEYWPDLAQGIRNGLFGSCSRNEVAMRNEKGIEFQSVSISSQ